MNDERRNLPQSSVHRSRTRASSVHRSSFIVQRSYSSAFTFVELLLGMVVTTMVLGAMMVFTLGVGQGYTQSESAQSVFLSGNMAVDRIQHVIRSAKLIDTNTLVTGSMDNSTPAASCMFWRDDGSVLFTDGSSGTIAANNDGKIQFSEMGLLQYDQSTSTVWEYNVQWPAGWSAAQITAANWTSEPPIPMMASASFKSSAHVAATPLAHNVKACQFFIIPGTGTQRPTLEFVLQINNGQASTVEYGAATLRSPNGEPQ
jgi:hypothetical protein